MRITRELAESTARAALAQPYRQIDTLTTHAFAGWLGDRGISLQWTTLHQHWRAAIIRPIAVLEPAVEAAPDIVDRLVSVDLGLDVLSYVDLGADAPLATELDPGWELPGELTRCLIWHPFQIWQFMSLAGVLESRIGLDASLFGRASFVDTAEHVFSSVPQRLVRFVASESNGEYERVLSLLLAVEPLVHTQVNSRIKLRPHYDESLEDYYGWIRSQDGGALLCSVGLTLEAATTWHRDIAVRAQIEDPVESFREILRHADRDRRERMTGKALRAHTIYDMAEILRRYLEEYHDVQLIEEDDARHGPLGPEAKERLYGARRTADFDRVVFRRMARRFNLDPQARVTWFVEGDTKEGFIGRLAELLNLDFAQGGVEVMNLNGLGTLAGPYLRGLLERYRREESFVLISVDEDARGDRLRTLRRYSREGLVSAGFRIWKRDFEEENFSVDELASVANLYAKRGEVDTSLTAAAIIKEMTADGTLRRTVGGAVERLWRRAGFYQGKGRRWGETLADWLVEHDDTTALDDRQSPRRILETIKQVLQGQWSDYQATVRFCTIDDSGNVVERTTVQ